MKDELQDTKDFLQDISDQIHYFVRNNVPNDFVLICQIILKFLFLAGVVYLLDFIFKILVNTIFKYFFDKEKYPALKSIYQSRITNSIVHLGALSFAESALKSVFWRHPKSFELLGVIVGVSIIFVIAGMLFRALTALRNYFVIKQDFYKIMALNAISESVKIFGIFILTVVGICLIFGIKGGTILGSLGAITAVLVLVFRDTILGFVTGLHVATSKNMKVGDWIGIPKYNIEGNIADISLLTTKITNFDKTVSTIPTYDLLTTEIKNLQVMSESNTRRIKKSIFFNINSFKFLNDEDIERLKDINLISEYLEGKSVEIRNEKEKLAHKDKIVNGRQLTNIGVFRYYAQKYIENDPDIDEKGMRMVRQLDITPHGLPLEIYCFTNDSKWERFEQIQADIFDHLLVASKEFDLQVMQVTLKV
ncbi:mechanosensitive ion channel protein MscS [Chryseobacterium piperi]|uniref:Mechanosensitive ion channel protein MscS n=1 Tax=Chryseobacterium piperi TaxID=558152 RepID=A0A086BKK6_9FLAO|nr:mechanosensitive ion channel family protein [Chryseobacterium piperi]ATL75897.1 mechanosensitive ion channel family protein [Chryseobacterium piperi]KFF29470.1 mechanosensitive ion channel protein MscS [Chryseobacterium piperi]